MKKNTVSTQPFQGLREGKRVAIPFVVSLKDLKRFEKLSGDSNPIHCDNRYARSHGLRGRAVYGAQMIAVVSRLLGMSLPGKGWIWHSLNMKFHSPLYVAERAILHGRIIYCQSELGILRIALEIKRARRMLAAGEAQMGLLKSF